MSELKKSYTQIIEPARRQLGISRDEYALCSYLQYRAADPRQAKPGWCCDEKLEIAEFVGVTRAGLYKMAERLILEGLIDVGGGVPFAWRVTPKWIDTESQCKQSLHDGVNKVDTRRKQSLHDGVNKVDTHNKAEYDISENEFEEKEKGAALPLSSSKKENETLKAEKETPPQSCAPPPPLLPPFTPTGETIEPQPAKIVRLYESELPSVTVVDSVPAIYETAKNPRELPPEHLQRVDIGAEIERLKTDAAAKETFSLVRKIPSNLYADYVEAFGREVGGTGETYQNTPAFRKHFFNWSGTRYEIAQKRATQTNGKGNSHISQAGGNLSVYQEKQIF